MIIRYQGHAFFTLTLENGTVIAMDPYDAFYQYPRRKLTADVVTMSHQHHDHNGTGAIVGEYKAVETTGVHRLGYCTITGIDTWHDHHQGSRRGKNIFFVIEAEGLRIGHAGDLGHLLSEEKVKAIGKLDILLLPVGGTYTVDKDEAKAVWQQLKPAVCIPMHYRTEYDPEMPVTTLEDFLATVNKEHISLPVMRATAGDMSQRPPIVVMEIEKA